MDHNTNRGFFRENWLALLLISVLIGGYLLLYTPGDQLASTEEFDALVSSGTPTLVEFFTNT
ncbi:MAG: hypothetical protein E3J64_09310 [Anaerolineales bacterium]|nr:MAG: hypothetical protein E3J64_09310 [Anaerolineales bacterium]